MPTSPMNDLRPKFWENYSLSELTDAEWEALCDGCGACCLVKFLDEDDVRYTEYTDVACQLLDCTTGHCRDYENRARHVPDCIRLTPQMMPAMGWLPRHCSYKRLYLGQSLPTWHRLLRLDKDGETATHGAGFMKVSTAGRCVSEVGLDDAQIEERLIKWIKI